MRRMDAKQELANVMKLFKQKIMARGARGIVGLQRVFKIMDDDGSRTLSPYEFGKACKDFKMGIPEENFPMLFDAFDTNRDGTLNVDEFLMAIRGEMSPARTSMVEAAFRKIDSDNSGFFGMEDIRDIYKADRHPDVLQGKRTEHQVLIEFLETFEAHHNLKDNEQADGKVSLEEFIEYYKNISCSIDNDDYFALMINNSWNVNEKANTYQRQKPAVMIEDNVSENLDYIHNYEPVRQSGQMSNENPMALTNRYYQPRESARVSHNHGTNKLF
jgi:Ca2+-binding EF-hand superfamily protein